MSLSFVVQKERKTYKRRRDILRGVRFFVSDLFQKGSSWRAKRRKKITRALRRACASPSFRRNYIFRYFSIFFVFFWRTGTCYAGELFLAHGIRELPEWESHPVFDGRLTKRVAPSYFLVVYR